MEEAVKIVAAVLPAVVLWILLDKRDKDFSLLLTLGACCGVAAAAAAYLKPVFALLRQLEELGQLQSGMLGQLLKAVGMGFLTETAGTVCADAGNSSMGSVIRFFGSAVILHLSIPIAQALLTLVQEILGIL